MTQTQTGPQMRRTTGPQMTQIQPGPQMTQTPPGPQMHNRYGRTWSQRRTMADERAPQTSRHPGNPEMAAWVCG